MPLAAFFTWLAAFFGKDAKNLSFNLAKYVAFTAYVVFAFGIFLATIFTLLDTVAVSFPSIANDVWSWFMPPNATGCLTAIISARVLRAILDYKLAMASKKLQMLRST